MEIVNEMEKALKRMEEKGRKDSFYYERLKAKKEAIEQGKEYKVVKNGKLALAMMIGAIGAEIPKINKGFKKQGLDANLSIGEMDTEKLEESAREILGYNKEG